MNSRLLKIQNGFNFRELGGYQTQDGHHVKAHKIIRSGKLVDLSDQDLTYLADYGVIENIDFRSPKEAKNEPDRLSKGMSYIFDPVFRYDETESSHAEQKEDDDMAKVAGLGHKNMMSAYNNLITDTHPQKAYQQFFERLLTNTQDNQSILFHCSAGKDRTGIGAYLFLRALGVDAATAKQDYLLTNEVTRAAIQASLDQLDSKEPILVENVKALNSVNEDYLAQAMSDLKLMSGTVDNYLQEVLNLSTSDLNDLKKIYLTA